MPVGRYVRNPLALPLVLAAIPALFHVVRVALGASYQDATAAGWLMPGQARHLWPCGPRV